MSTSRLRPDWVIVGIRATDVEVWIVACRNLAQVEMTQEWDLDCSFDWEPRPFHQARSHTTLSVVMGDHVVVRAASYSAAFERLHDLFRQWDKSPVKTPALSIKRELDP